MTGVPGDVTRLLREFQPGDGEAASRLIALIYPELKRIARSRLQHEREDYDLQPTALVHEAYIRLVAHEQHTWESRAHFFAASANIMRRVLVDHARSRNAQKRRGERASIPLDEAIAMTGEQSADLLDLDRALTELEQLSPRQARVVELRYFAGLSVPEAAGALGVNPRSVDRDWAAAILSDSDVITASHLLPAPAPAPGSASASTPATLDQLERAAIERVLAEVGGNRRAAAERLGIGLRTLYEKLKKYRGE